MNPADQAYVHSARFLVWTDHRARETLASSSYGGTWFWVAHGPRGAESGVEMTAEAAYDRAYAAYLLVMGEHERHPPKPSTGAAA